MPENRNTGPWDEISDMPRYLILWDTDLKSWVSLGTSPTSLRSTLTLVPALPVIKQPQSTCYALHTLLAPPTSSSPSINGQNLLAESGTLTLSESAQPQRAFMWLSIRIRLANTIAIREAMGWANCFPNPRRSANRAPHCINECTRQQQQQQQQRRQRQQRQQQRMNVPLPLLKTYIYKMRVQAPQEAMTIKIYAACCMLRMEKSNSFFSTVL
ncbi:hypothetical protein AJ78_04514 [Emergomyces pasteurianus Ep9510]|uniref:Uncharacterized protein n=1 Tax=Emergomyces pasteurianus Ep9510 TaxID=1447872 RepID=A0A1J9QGB9_9EURO|nr:hypothetical protein AJ78_04514 [Emergomyces pasteurianus Ep9510]